MNASDKELEALLRFKRLMKSGNPEMPEFIQWLHDRMINQYHEPAEMDYVKATERYARELAAIRSLLS